MSRCYNNKRLQGVLEITHVGIVYKNTCSSKVRIENACKSKMGVMAHLRSGVHPAALNPMTSAKIIKQTLFASELYGCEFWFLNTEKSLMLERAQHFIAKHIQGFDILTRFDMATSLLGWTSIISCVNIKKVIICWTTVTFWPSKFYYQD